MDYLGATPEKTLLLVRHGRIGYEYHGRFVGGTDVSLAADARSEIEALAKLIRRRRPAKCFCSPMKRARQTADVIATQVGLNPEVDADLREVDFGRWEGLTFAEIAASDPEIVDRWASWEEDFAFPEGESLRDFLARVKNAAERLIADSAETILVVSHGGVIRTMICHLLGLPLRQHLLFDVRRASLATIRVIGRRGVLTELNAGPYLGE